MTQSHLKFFQNTRMTQDLKRQNHPELRSYYSLHPSGFIKSNDRMKQLEVCAKIASASMQSKRRSMQSKRRTKIQTKFPSSYRLVKVDIHCNEHGHSFTCEK